MWFFLLASTRGFWRGLIFFIACLSLFVFQKSFGFTAIVFLLAFIFILCVAPVLTIPLVIIWFITAMNNYDFGWIADTIEFGIVAIGALIFSAIWWGLMGKYHTWRFKRKAKKATQRS